MKLSRYTRNSLIRTTACLALALFLALRLLYKAGGQRKRPRHASSDVDAFGIPWLDH